MTEVQKLDRLLDLTREHYEVGNSDAEEKERMRLLRELTEMLEWVDDTEGVHLTHGDATTAVRTLPSDYAPYGSEDRDAYGGWGPDCSMGCRWFAPLAGPLGSDWGVCMNPASHRVGLLTFEHQGCRHYEDGARVLTQP